MLMRAFQASIWPAFVVTIIILGTCISFAQASAAPAHEPTSLDLTIPNIHGSSFSASDSPPSSTQSPSEFTRANVFGMFLTIQLCQLTQPYGSLLFRGVHGWFWRVSPIASFLEGCVITVLLIFSRDRSCASAKGFNVAAAALLLYRNGSEETNNPSETTPIPLSSVPNAGTAIETPHCNDSPHPRRLELDGISDAHKQWRITLFTTISVAVVFIKLCAVTGVPVFASAMIGLLFGWTMVQSLLLLFHWRDMAEGEVSRAIHLCGKIRVSLRTNDVTLQICFIALHLPLFGYPGWLFVFKSAVPSDPIVSFYYGPLCRVLAMVFVVSFQAFIFTLFSPIVLWDWRHILVCVIVLAIGTPFFAWLVFASALEGGWLTQFSIPTDIITTLVHPYRFIVRSFVLISILIVIVLLFCLLMYNTSHGPSVASFFLTAILFLIYLIRYDSSGTYKPNWTDWLG